MHNDTRKPSANGHADRLASFWQSDEFRRVHDRVRGKSPPSARPAALEPPQAKPVVRVPVREGRHLSPSHAAELEASGIPAGYALDNGVYTETDQVTVARRLKWVPPTSLVPCIAFEHIDPAGKPTGYVRYKPATPRPDPKKAGKRVKYEQPKDTPIAPFIPTGTRPALTDPAVDLCLTEGEKKALCADHHGCPCVSIPGVGTWRKNGELIPALASIKWKGRKVYVVFDSDAATNPNVCREERELAAELTRRGAVVTVVRLPPGEGGKKIGLDDYIVGRGVDAFRRLLAARPAAGINVNRIRTVHAAAPGNGLTLIPPPLGADAYHGLVGGLVRALSPLTEATDAGVIAHVLTAAGCLIGPRVFVYAGGRHPPRVNAVLVGPTNSGRKGTAEGVARELIAHAAPKFLRERVLGGLSTGEGLIAAVADKVRRDKEGNETVVPTDRRLLVLESEWSKVLAQTRRDGNILSQVVRQGFDSGDLGVMTRGDPLKATGAHVCLIGHVTPEELGERLSGVEMTNGFGNRFLWFYVRSDKLLPRTAPIPTDVFAPLAARLRAVANSPDRVVPLSNLADRLWCDELYPRLREDRPGLAGAMTARGTAFVLRLALVYCLLDRKEHRGAIRVAHLKAALAVWDYSVASAYLLFRSETGSALGDKLLSLLAAGPLKRNQFTDHVARPSGEIEAELNKLLAAGRVKKTKEKRSGAGRPAEVWELAPPPGGN